MYNLNRKRITTIGKELKLMRISIVGECDMKILYAMQRSVKISITLNMPNRAVLLRKTIGSIHQKE